MTPKQGKAIIFSAPSGSGKTSIVKELILANPILSFSISACTRSPRDKIEQSGKDYYFLSLAEFKQKIEKGEFVEWEEVYPGKLYGTLKSEVERVWSEGRVIIFDVDVVGGVHLKEYFGDAALAVFVKVPSIDLLRKRLTQRKSESEAELNIRLEKAAYELTYADRFDKIVVNDNLSDAVAQAQNLLNAFLDD